jgi:hypothetical protein
LRNVIQKYVQLGEPIFGTLVADLDETTFATLIERRKIDGNSRDRYVAIIDCRGQKGLRRFFTKWHEIAHLLTIQGQLELPLHRSTTNKNPTERLMDTIAGEIGFYEPIFTPILEEEFAKDGRLTFETVERIRTRFSPEASFQATLNACVKRINSPLLIAEIGLGFKKEEERQIHSRQQNLFSVPQPEAKLRVLTIASNELARGSALQLHRNMEVPKGSVLYKLFFNHDQFQEDEIQRMENLNLWRHSDGGSLANLFVNIQARRMQDTIIALVSRKS